MNKCFCLVITLLFVLCISCQKEVSTELPVDPVPPSDTTGTVNKLLEEIVIMEAPDDSVAEHFYYNSGNKLIKITDESFGPLLENLSYYNSELRLYRNGQEVIERLVEVRFHYEGFDLQRTDSSVYEVFHNPANGYYTHAIHYTALEWYNPTEITRDSIAYSYNNDGQMDLVQVFRKDILTGNYFEAERREYTYNNQENIIKVRANENYDNTGDPLGDYFMTEYDDKINPLNFGYECLLRGLEAYGYPSPNNFTKTRDNSGTYNYAYTYNEFDMPETLISKEGDIVWSISKFYYR